MPIAFSYRSRARLSSLVAAALCWAAPAIGLTTEPATAPAALIPLREGYSSGCGAVIYYKTVGQGRPLIVLHGGPGSSHDYFLPYLLPLAQHHQLIFLDERGSGRSERLADAKKYTLDAMACDVDALRRGLNLGPTDVLGHSFGGILAQAYAIKYAKNVTRLILAGTSSSAARLNADFKQIKDSLKPDLRAKIDSLEAKGILGADGAQLPEYRRAADEAELPYNYWVKPPPWSAPGEDLGWDVLNEMWGSKSDFHIDGNLTGYNFVPELRKLSMPTLVIAGDHDLPSIATLEETHAAVAHSELVVVKNSGHMTFVEQSGAFMDAVVKFLDR